ncbi:MAG: WecB/TagA/CpsF family glycosyltransferase [Deltaproteobacteria bacterium]|nr:WecB/TagA/CpsF family glycosyltransferase [Deltaproteobacteria bacterium]
MNQGKNRLFGLEFDNLNLEETLEKIDELVHSKKPHMIFTPNVALTVWARKNPFLKEVYDRCDLLLVDGMAIYYASQILGKPCKENVAAFRVFLKLLEEGPKKGYRFYFFGAKEEAVKKAVENTRLKYPGIQIIGYRNGYFKQEEVPGIVQEISNTKPDILFVAMPTPQKEKFVAENLNKMGVPVSLGVGGSFDIVAGLCKQAPHWMTVLCLEWFYRLVQEPRRMWKRYLTTNLVFLRLFFVEFWKKYALLGRPL